MAERTAIAPMVAMYPHLPPWVSTTNTRLRLAAALCLMASQASTRAFKLVSLPRLYSVTGTLLLMVAGRWTTGTQSGGYASRASSSSTREVKASNPPISIKALMLCSWNLDATCPMLIEGRVLLVPSSDPPRGIQLSTPSQVRGVMLSSRRPGNPLYTARGVWPWWRQYRTAARVAAFIPPAGAPRLGENQKTPIPTYNTLTA